jgi:hypothetical protein
MSKYGLKLTKRICSLGLIVLIAGLTTAFLGAYHFLPLDPNVIIPATLLILIFLGCLAGSSTISGTSFITRIPFLQQPSDPEDGIFKRLIKDKETGEECIIQGTKESTYREVLVDLWPFSDRKKTSHWYVTDHQGNNITDKLLSEYDSIVEIVFE